MANLTTSQKKSRNNFILLLIAIIVVAACSVYVIFSGLSAQSSFFESKQIAGAFADIFDKTASSITEADLASVKYLEVVSTDANGQYSIAVGFDDFIAEYDAYAKQQEAANEASKLKAEAEAAEAAEAEKDESSSVDALTDKVKAEDIVIPEITADPAKFTKSASFKATGTVVFDALQYFTGVKMLSINDVAIDTSVIAKLENLTTIYLENNGIKDVSDFAMLNFDKIESLSFAENDISDWTSLIPYGDKVNVIQYTQIDLGGYAYDYPISATLTEYLASSQQDEGVESETTEQTLENTDNAQDSTDNTAEQE